jgi:hypothetical protein
MPIHLRPLSRRTFLRRALLAGAGLTLTPHLHAAMRRTDASSFALLADTHIAAESAVVHRGVNMSEHFRAVAREIIGLPERAARVFIVGDCAFSAGEPADYVQLSSLLDSLRADRLNLTLALGNHDQRENFWTALESQKAARRPIAQKQVAFIKTKHLNWLVLDSLEKTLQTPGALGADQLEWVEKTLDANQKMPTVIVVHHNPGEDNKIGGLKDTEALLEIIRPRKQVKAWIYGHTHNWKVTEDSSGIHLVNLPPVSYIFREGDPAGWIHATTRPDGMKLELRAIDSSHKAHGQVVDLKWRA